MMSETSPEVINEFLGNCAPKPDACTCNVVSVPFKSVIFEVEYYLLLWLLKKRLEELYPSSDRDRTRTARVFHKFFLLMLLLVGSVLVLLVDSSDSLLVMVSVVVVYKSVGSL